METATKTPSNRKLVLTDILEQRAYERIRETRRAEIIELKRRRRIALGTIVTGGLPCYDQSAELSSPPSSRCVESSIQLRSPHRERRSRGMQFAYSQPR